MTRLSCNCSTDNTSLVLPSANQKYLKPCEPKMLILRLLMHHRLKTYYKLYHIYPALLPFASPCCSTIACRHHLLVYTTVRSPPRGVTHNNHFFALTHIPQTYNKYIEVHMFCFTIFRKTTIVGVTFSITHTTQNHPITSHKSLVLSQDNPRRSP